MLKQDVMQVSQDQPIYSEAPLQLLLFVDGRTQSRQQVQQIRAYLKELEAGYSFELQIIDVGEQPYLAEHFKLIATPALVKIHPQPQQTIAGTNIIPQLKIWWPRWQTSVDTFLSLQEDSPELMDEKSRVNLPKSTIHSVASSAETIQLSDEIFRLKQEKEKLQEQLQFKDRVIAILAHDLRNPLTAAAIAIETLQSTYNPDTGEFTRLKPGLAIHLLKQARAQTRIIDRMIADLLQVGRGDDTQLPIVPQKLQLGELCLQVLEELSDRYIAKSQTVETDIPQDLPYVYADPERIRQVLVNLLDNAIKYTPAGGVITVAGLHRTTQKVQFSVGDTGPGIPEENRDRIFENLFRLQRDQATDGYGIGLCLCQRIIRAHYGQIWVDSSPHGGAWFHFTMPVYPS
ncbi:histidine kinase [Dolichospermum sp. ST_con]|nr:histidine kinase [Dolichospermum sp. ST_con]MDD1420158.1 histidine kinase [Dolichospermum sp. ST_sed1]MDD1426404.1 histidine kinase [Dolichospermum sp. ST_sed9]MDD1432956.1 histidine kinase [Dolichospermum sp. ST_sed6]MDD1435964.1 histidine kinase [Dolichospermum sp. ST_sed10]MDD1441701.1 histidine kinase [Dolichospermum sp. ST_sed3]MDD1446032.1 histidine kinase [Dolichospermum sp. ST_sed8]MDD1455653.1 histidine kinase [Dolichospermum sp. ST_sed7]MDD1462132.1 histidine kinase [Dolichospe